MEKLGRGMVRNPDAVSARPAFIERSARLSRCGRYRHALCRDWTGPERTARVILWIGLNPSIADASLDDPTLRREVAFSRDWGFTRYLKGNLLDWRATSPRDLPRVLDLARSAANLAILRKLALEAETVVLASGRVPPGLARALTETLGLLDEIGRPASCLGQNADGTPKHPLYLRKETEPRRFDPNALRHAV